jgi:hypothetical protein
MKVLLDVKEHKAAFVLELLRSLPFVKAEPISDGKALLLGEIREAVEEMKQIKKGNRKARPAADFLHEV